LNVCCDEVAMVRPVLAAEASERTQGVAWE
jgi:hypothetical protein